MIHPLPTQENQWAKGLLVDLDMWVHTKIRQLRFLFGQLFRSLVKTIVPNWTVRKKIGGWGYFAISAKFLFSDFSTWSGGHNSGFDYLISSAQKKTCVFDVGAHIGITTLPLAQAVGSGGRVFAVEPSLQNRTFLNRHLEANKIENVTVLDCALTDHSGQAVTFFEMKDVSGMNGLLNNRSGMHSIQVSASTLDQVASEFNVVPDLIKIDIEGAELACLKGAINTIQLYQPEIVLSVHPRQMQEMGNHVEELEVFLDQMGYDVVDILSGSSADRPLGFGEYVLQAKSSSPAA